MEINYIFYIFLTGIAGSSTAFLKSEKTGIKEFLKGAWDGCFSGFILYKLAFYFSKSEELSFVACGVGAWFGSEIFIFVRSLIANKFGGNSYDSYDDRRF